MNTKTNNHLIIIPILLFIVACEDIDNNAVKFVDGKFLLSFENQSQSPFFTDKVFRNIEMTPLETDDHCLIGNREHLAGSRPELKLDESYIFIQDYQQQVVFRFDKDGKFLNRIGSRGRGPMEYISIEDFEINPVDSEIEILSQQGKMVRYNYDGTFESSHNYDKNATSFINTGNNYWFFLSAWQIGDERLIKISKDGIISKKFLPNKMNWIPISLDRNFSKCGDTFTFKEMYYQSVYQITEDGPVEKTIIDFGIYQIPEQSYSKEFDMAMEELNTNGWITIDKYLENDQYIYLFFWLWKSDEKDTNFHWLINKKTKNSVLQHFTTENPLYEMMQEAKLLTSNNKLIFLADAQMLKTCTDTFFNTSTNFKSSLSEDDNPVIISLQINDF